VDVEQHDIGQSFRDQLDSRRDFVCFPDDHNRFSELASDPRAEEVMVVDEEDCGNTGRVHG
jgi:hypothetical protein